MNKTYCIDVDGTICDERKTFEKSLAEPKQDIINIVNKLYSAGNRIIIYTARGWGEYSMTERWLEDNGVKYHQLLCGKPIADVFLDDRAVNVKDADKLLGTNQANKGKGE